MFISSLLVHFLNSNIKLIMQAVRLHWCTNFARQVLSCQNRKSNFGRFVIFFVIIGCGVVGLYFGQLRLEAVNSIEKIKHREDEDHGNIRDISPQPDRSSANSNIPSLVIYNRIPKTGSTSLANMAYELHVKNHFHVLHLNVSKNNHVLSLPDQMRFVTNITTWYARKPAFYHGHLAYLEFSRFGVVERPVYINIIREPLKRLVSYFYFVRYGDDFRPHLRRRKAGNRETFDECVQQGGKECNGESLWIQIPFFCGHAAECWVAGSQWAFEMAKYNVVNNYLLVGVTEALEDFVVVLEATLPQMFRGATQLYRSGQFSHMRKTNNKKAPTQETVERMRESSPRIWQLEYDFYNFVREHFEDVKQRTLAGMVDGEHKQQFVYEKVKPR